MGYSAKRFFARSLALLFIPFFVTLLLYDWKAAIAITVSVASVAAIILLAWPIMRRRIEGIVHGEAKTVNRQLQGYVAMAAVLGDAQPLPQLDGWTLSPDNGAELVRQIYEKRPSVLVELGSGSSTIIAAALMEKLGSGHIYSVEHESAFADQTRGLVARAGLAHRVMLIEAPLTEVSVGGTTVEWYDPNMLEQLPESIDLLLVDGPPERSSEMARYPAFPMLKARLGESAVVLLDDARRRDESRILKRWGAENPDWEFRMERTSAGIGIGTRVQR